VHRKANLVGRLSDDLDPHRGGPGLGLAGIAAVSERRGDDRERAPRQAQNHKGPIPILHVRRLRLQDQTTPVGVDHDLTLAALDLLAGI
jgi:hypothetical protein